MSGALKRPYQLAELAKLAEPLVDALSLDDVPRFVEALGIEQRSDTGIDCQLGATASGSAQIHVSGFVHTNVVIECQRCMGEVPWPMELQVAWEIQGHDEISLLDWIEDELILSLPTYARHEGNDCDSQLVEKYRAAEDDTAAETTKAFAGLKDLLSGN